MIPSSVCIKNNMTLNDVDTNNMKEILEITNNKLQTVCSDAIKDIAQNMFIDTVKSFMDTIQNTSSKRSEFTEVGKKLNWENDLYTRDVVFKDAMNPLDLLHNEFVIDYSAYGESSTVQCIGITNLARIFITTPITNSPILVKLEGEPLPLTNEYIVLLSQTDKICSFYNFHQHREAKPKYYYGIIENYKKYNLNINERYNLEKQKQQILQQNNELEKSKKLIEKTKKELDDKNNEILNKENLLKQRLLNVSKRELKIQQTLDIHQTQLDLEKKNNELINFTENLLNIIDTAECELELKTTSISKTCVTNLLDKLLNNRIEPPSYEEVCNN